ncbi:MAG: glycosyltransferase [Anaerolineaceae bacterium]|jgi:glycosyltransferase involved in cell wall biosynthesis|nr:MAG: glycosyltransferase [Anaerolineaceae bacterium]
MHPSIRVRHLPSSPRWREKIIYIARLTEELEKQGIQIDYADDKAGDYLTKQLLNTPQLQKPDILHFHWTSYQYEGNSTSSTLFNLMKYMVKLKQAKNRGYKIIWTMHNYLPHEKGAFLNYIERLWMAHLADAIIVHANRGKELLAKRLFRQQEVYVIPHGNYIPFFTRTPRQQAKQKLSVPSGKPMLLYFGYIRPYKGVADLLQAFRSLPDLDVSLYLVGNAPEKTRNEIQMFIGKDVRIISNLQYVADEELALYLSAADLVVLPYLDILGSGALMTALSFGCPVIAPSIGAFAEFLDEGCGYLYTPCKNGLKSALEEIPNLDLANMSKKALARALQYPWEGMVRQIVNLYQYIYLEKEFGMWIEDIHTGRFS